MEISQLPKVVSRRAKRVGRGYGSGKGGHTSGRGQKGQKSRGKIGILFEGVKTKKSLLRRLPQLRGKGRFKPYPKPVIVNLSKLNKLSSGSKVTLELLVKSKIVDDTAAGVKILGEGELKKKLIVQVPASQGAKKAIEKAGGKVETIS